jgi:hypothetical protein
LKKLYNTNALWIIVVINPAGFPQEFRPGGRLTLSGKFKGSGGLSRVCADDPNRAQFFRLASQNRRLVHSRCI